jgi:hypothetical protein
MPLSRASSTIALFLNFLKQLICVRTAILEAVAEVIIERIKLRGLSWARRRLDWPFQTEITANGVASEIESSSNGVDTVPLLVHFFLLIDEFLLPLCFGE